MIDRVVATKVRKVFKEASAHVVALQEVSFQITQGSSVALLGQALSGKTTLIHLLAGLETISGGSLHIFSKELATLTEAARANYRREVGLLSPVVPWLPQFSLRDNVALPLLVANVPRREAEKRVGEMCAWFELSDAPRIEALSPLSQQRWSLARALIHQPRLLLVDSSLEELAEAEPFVEELLDKARHLSVTLFFTTRQARLAAYAEEILSFKAGRLVGQQTSAVQGLAAQSVVS